MTLPAKTAPESGDIMQSVLMAGDLDKLTPQQRVDYYNATCKSLGLNPLTRPFEFIRLNGQLRMYAARNCADQLRKINGVSLKIMSRDVADDILTVHVQASLPDGRVDEDLGSVPFPATLKGEARANAELKCITKAKRRATLSICGLGWLDDSEVDSIPGAQRRPPTPAPNVLLHNPVAHGEPYDPLARVNNPAAPQPEAALPSGDKVQPEPAANPPSPPGGGGLSILDMAREAAMRGNAFFYAKFWDERTPAERKQLLTIKDELNQLMEGADEA